MPITARPTMHINVEESDAISLVSGDVMSYVLDDCTLILGLSSGYKITIRGGLLPLIAGEITARAVLKRITE